MAMPDNEVAIRIGFFFAVFVVVGFWEAIGARRTRSFSRVVRWPNNLAVVAADALLLRLMAPAGMIGIAVYVENAGFGLLNAVALPVWVAVLVSVVVLDLAIYVQHVLFHAVPALWRLHRMHHADLDFDVTTGFRFHPLEIALSLGIKMMVVAALGPPAVAVLIFEVLLNATSMFNHGNLRIGPAIDRILRLFVVTPDMHRVHHSILPSETNSNFGFSLPWWDRLFGTYVAQPADGHEGMEIGLDRFRDPGELRFDRMMLQPFRGDAGNHPINRRGGREAGR